MHTVYPCDMDHVINDDLPASFAPWDSVQIDRASVLPQLAGREVEMDCRDASHHIRILMKLLMHHLTCDSY